MIDRVRENLLDGCVGVVVDGARLCSVRVLRGQAPDLAVLEEGERVDELPLNGASEDLFDHVLPRRIGHFYDIDARVPKIALDVIGEHEDSDVARPEVLGRSRCELKILGEFEKTYLCRLRVKGASYLAQVVAHERRAQVVDARGEVGAIVEGDVA